MTKDRMNDKDEFINKKNLLQEFANEIYKFDSVDGEFQRGVNWALRMIIKHPTTDVEPVVHAHWTYWGWSQHCSHCEHVFEDLYDDNYCPNCGAKMDEKETD